MNFFCNFTITEGTKMAAFSDENELMEQFRNGDETALKDIYVRYHRSLCYFGAKISGDLQEAEDIASEIFIKLWDKRQDFKTVASVRSFLFTAVKNRTLNYLRHQKVDAHARRHLEYKVLKNENILINEEAESEILRILYNEIESLPGQCKLIFNMLNFGGLSTTQVAEKLEISPQTVRNQKTKAIQLLKTAVLKKNLSVETMLICVCILTM